MKAFKNLLNIKPKARPDLKPKEESQPLIEKNKPVENNPSQKPLTQKESVKILKEKVVEQQVKVKNTLDEHIDTITAKTIPNLDDLPSEDDMASMFGKRKPRETTKEIKPLLNKDEPGINSDTKKYRGFPCCFWPVTEEQDENVGSKGTTPVYHTKK